MIRSYRLDAISTYRHSLSCLYHASFIYVVREVATDTSYVRNKPRGQYVLRTLKTHWRRYFDACSNVLLNISRLSCTSVISYFFSPIAFSLYHDHLRLYAIFNTYTLMILRWNPGGIEVAYSFSKLHGTPFFPRKCFSLVVQAKLDIIMYTTDDRRWMCVSLFVVSKAIYSNIQCVVVCSPILINLY